MKLKEVVTWKGVVKGVTSTECNLGVGEVFKLEMHTFFVFENSTHKSQQSQSMCSVLNNSNYIMIKENNKNILNLLSSQSIMIKNLDPFYTWILVHSKIFLTIHITY